MGDERLSDIVKQLEVVHGRKAMFAGSNSSSAMSAYLSGYQSAVAAFGVPLPHAIRQSVTEERGWMGSAEVWPMSEMRERGLTDEAMADEMLAIDIAAWQRVATGTESAGVLAQTEERIMSRSRETGVLAVLLFFCLTLASGVEAKQKSTSNYGTPLSAVDKQHLLNDTFVIVKTVSAIPKSVQRHLLGKSVEAGMADAGQPFQITDVISGKSLPFQRLIFAGTSSGYCFVYSEHGGFGYWTNVHLYRLSDAKAELVWRGTPQPRLNILDLSQLRGAIAAGKFTNDQLPASKNSY